MTPEQKSSLLALAQMWENAPPGDAAGEQYDAMEAYVDQLLAQARAEEREAAAKVCEAEIPLWIARAEPAIQSCAAAIRAQGQGQGGGNG